MKMIILMLSTTLINMKHPLPMGLILILTAISSMMYTIFMTNSSWYAYIFFIIFVGGVLILFLYMASISPNSLTKTNFIMPLMLMFMIYPNLSMNSLNQQTMNLSTMKIMMNMPTSIMMPLLASYLLMTMILVIKLTNKNMNPLRKML